LPFDGLKLLNSDRISKLTWLFFMRTQPFLDSFKYMFGFASWTTVAFDVVSVGEYPHCDLVYRCDPE